MKISVMPTNQEHPEKPSSACKTSVFRRIFRPYVVLMDIFGCHFVVAKSEKAKKRLNPMKLYCRVVLVILWGVFFKSFVTYSEGDGFGSELFNKIVYTVWTFQCAAQATILYLGWCCNYDTFFTDLMDLCCQDYRDNPKQMKRAVNIVIVYTVIFSFLMAINLSILGYMYFDTFLLDNTLKPVKLGSDLEMPMRVFLFILSFWQTAGWLLPLGLCLLISQTLIERYTTLNEAIEQVVTECSEGNTSPDIHPYRTKHEQLTALVHCADSTVKLQTGVLMGCSAVIVCLAMYVALWDDNVKANTVALAGTYFWVVVGLLAIFSMLFGTSRVNSVAHDAVDSLYKIDLTYVEPSSKNALELSVFISRLNGTPIGFSAMSFFTLDTGAILTIGGMLVTYFILLIQFKPAEADSTPVNCTCACT